ncbi:ATP-binding protein [Chloroflexota bacterium]
MNKKVLRKVIAIDEEKCDGCGLCVLACAEGAIKIIDGKAKLISEKYCDGLGVCIGDCPREAINIQEKLAYEYDDEEVKKNLQAQDSASTDVPCDCPSMAFQQSSQKLTSHNNENCESGNISALSHWPIQLSLVSPAAAFLKDSDVLLAADCAPFAYAGFHNDFLTRKPILIACPKLDDFNFHLAKLAEILRQQTVKSIHVIRMEVPCCSGLKRMAEMAVESSGKKIPVQESIISIGGKVL